ncbi:hypothetical protein KAW96_01625 [candidate division WOR-3 bacterium]|nr:hypothetical protein [candidate division WOR-3 bacterium]
MKIPLLTYLHSAKMTYLNNAVVLRTQHNRITTVFILDTGSPKTVIGYFDASRLQIPLNSSENETISIGGRKFWGRIFQKLKFVFKNEEGERVVEEMPVYVIKPTSPKELDEANKFPTIIGTDFLKLKKYKLYCDIANDDAYLEK